MDKKGRAMECLSAIVTELYGEWPTDDAPDEECYANPDKEWSPDTLDAVAHQLHEYGFGPGQEHCPLPSHEVRSRAPLPGSPLAPAVGNAPVRNR